MARRRNRNERVLGPYFDEFGGRWRLIMVGTRGKRTYRYYETEEQARQVARTARKDLNQPDTLSIEEAVEQYEVYMRDVKGNKATSAAITAIRLKSFFPDHALHLRELVPTRAEGYYEALTTRIGRTKKRLSVDTHRNMLAEAKTFLRWCVKKGWIRENPLEGVEGKGKRRRGKAQLRIDEARRWDRVAMAKAGAGKAGAVAALLTLYVDLRASEIVSRVVRDLDDEGRLLWIPHSKTDAGRRTLQVPAMLRPFLLRLAEGKKPNAFLFGEHDRHWVRAWVKRICREAKVPEVTAHGMRGLHASLAIEHGVTAHIVAQAMGHESESTTLGGSYATAESVAKAKQARVLQVMAGGRA